MKPMTRLLVADARRTWRQGLAISVLLACGTATFVMSTSTMRSLERSMERYYTDYRFADVFVQLTRAPNQLAEQLAEIPGVAQLQTRVIRSVILDVPGVSKPASCQLVSIGDQPTDELNGIVLLRGRFPNREGRVEVLASQPFADANGFQPGDAVTVVMGGRQVELHIVGIAISPEFVYAVQPGMILTDDHQYGILWMPRRQMEAAFNMEGAFNNATMVLSRGASKQDVIFQVDRLTHRFGGTGAYDRSDQPSHHRLADEMHQIKTMAFVTPAIFLSVATFLFNIALSQMVHQQTEQIATLRAFGYTSREIGWHYFKYVMILVTAGLSLGCLAGYRMSWWMTDVYVRFFRFPDVRYELANAETFVAILIGIAAALLGSYSAIRRAMHLPPAVAMRPEIPSPHSGFLTRKAGIKQFLSPLAQMIIRRLEANPRSTILSILGMAMGSAVLVLGSFFEDTVDYVTEIQFERSQRQDVMLTFNEQVSASALHDVLHLPGVQNAEPFRAVPVRLRNGRLEYRLSLMGLIETPSLFRVLDAKEHSIHLPREKGLTVSEKLAELMNLQVGDEVFVEILEGERETLRVVILAIFPDFTGPGAYIHLGELHRLLRESEQLSGAFTSIDSSYLNEFYLEVKQTPLIGGVLDKNAAKENFEETIAESTSAMRMVNAMFAWLIAFGVIFNCAVITLAERSRDLATLRVIGFSRWEVSIVLLGELAIITVLSMPIGSLFGYSFAFLTVEALDTETHRFPLVIHRATFAYAATIVSFVAAISSLLVRRRLDRLNLIAVLKVKE